MRVEKMQNLNDIRDTVSKLIRLYESQNYKKVIRTFSKNKEALVKNADALNILGATYVELGKQTEALNSYKKALLVDGKHSDTLNNLGILFFNLGDFEKAIEFYNQAKSTGLKNKNILNNLANSYRALGQFQKALENYSAALEVDPSVSSIWKSKIYTLFDANDFQEALNQLKIFSSVFQDEVFIYKVTSDCALALEIYDLALENLLKLESCINPDWIVKNNIGLCYLKLFNLKKAKENFKASILIENKIPNANFNLGLCYFEEKRFKEAYKFFKFTFSLDPNFPNIVTFLIKSLSYKNGVKIAYKNLIKDFERSFEALEVFAALFREEGNFDDELKVLYKCLEVAPDRGHILNLIGNSYGAAGDCGKAIKSYKEAVGAQEDNGLAFYNLGVTYGLMSRYNEAIHYYKKCIEILPNNLDARNNLAYLLSQTGNLEDAINMFLSIIKIDWNYAAAHANCGHVFLKRAEVNKAISAFETVISLKPEDADSFNNLGNAYKAKGDLAKTIACYKQAVDLDKGHPGALYNLCYNLANACDWDVLDDYLSAVGSVGIKHGGFSPFGFWQYSDDPELHLLRAEAYTQSKYFQEAVPINPAESQSRKIKLAFFSSDFRTHPVTFLILKVLEQLDRKVFEVSAYSFEPDTGDEFRKMVEKTVDKFFDISRMGDEDVFKLGREEKLDIAIDLTGYTDKDRCIVFAKRIAPVQINFLGYPGTSGSGFFDYIIADRHVIPKKERKFYSESVIYMPDTYMPTDGSREIYKGEQTRKMYGLPEEAFVMCCFNNNYKISKKEFTIWIEVLKKIPNGVLWLRKSNELSQKNILKYAELLGFCKSRIVFAEMIDMDKHLSRHKLADIFVDTFNFNAHTTATEALFSGLPVITKVGRSFGARVCTSLLNAIGLPELVTKTEEEYKNLILFYAQNPKHLQKLKVKLTNNVKKYPLFNSRVYTKNLEKSLKFTLERTRNKSVFSDVYVDKI